MAFDGIVLHAITEELGGLIKGGRVEKIFQPGPSEISLLVHAGGEKYRLLLSADPVTAGMHLTRGKKENPSLPPPFCMVLRKYLTGSRISDVYQQGFDRVAVIEFETRNELGDVETKRLIAEFMNRRSNIILVNSAGIIHDAVRHADNSVNRFREIMPARPYSPPPSQEKLSPEDVAASGGEEILKRFLDRAGAGQDTGVSKAILNAVSGFSPLLCDAICEKAGVPARTAAGAVGESEKSKLIREITGACREISENIYRPAVLSGGNDFHCAGICAEVFGVETAYNTVNLAVDSFFGEKAREAELDKQKASLKRTVSGNIDKLSKKISEYVAELDEAAGFEREKELGELLTAALYSLPESAASVTVTDFFSDGAPEITVELDGSRSVAANAQLYFKKYRKHKATCEKVEKLKNSAALELDYLENVASMLKNASEAGEIADIRTELIIEGFLNEDGTGKDRSGQGRRAVRGENGINQPWSATMGGRPASKKTLRERAKAAKAGKNRNQGQKETGSGSVNAGQTDPGEPGQQSGPVVRYTKSGKRVIIGRNSLQNERLTMRESAPEDMWFHVKNAPGSHVVLKLKEAGGRAEDEDVIFAAQLAAYYSSQRSGSKVDVDYTAVKNVKKIPGGRPGMVIYYNFKTVTVNTIQETV